jgi:hypothetical protein
MPAFPPWNWPGWAWAIVAVLLLSLIRVGAVVRGELRRRSAESQEVTRQEHVRRTGQPGTAVVLRVTDTGTRLGVTTFFVIDLTLRVQAGGAVPAFDTTLRVPVSPVRLSDFAEGKVIQVRIDTDTREVAVDQRTR